MIADLLAHGHTVVNADNAPPRSADGSRFVRTDVTDFGQVMLLLGGEPRDFLPKPDAVVHLAAIPMPGQAPENVIFATNTLGTYNVFEACRKLGIGNIVWASSETLLGVPMNLVPPYLPLDEACEERPESAYSLTKLLGEKLADQFARWTPATKIVSLRYSNVMDASDYAQFEAFQHDPAARKWNLWGYIDARDAAQATRKALEANLTGAHTFIIANADTVMRRPNCELLAEHFPGVALKRETGPNETLLSIEKARRVLGYEPKFGWPR